LTSYDIQVNGDNVWQWLATGRWFSPSTPVTSTNKTDRHDITERVLKVALNTINLNQPTSSILLGWKSGLRHWANRLDPGCTFNFLIIREIEVWSHHRFAWECVSHNLLLLYVLMFCLSGGRLSIRIVLIYTALLGIVLRVA